MANAQVKPAQGANFSASILTERLTQTYQDMCLWRRFEERAAQMYMQGKIFGYFHTYNGQEAIMGGMRLVLRKTDDIITSYRCHAHTIASGIDSKAVMAELCGRRDGVSGGKGGSMHMFNPEGHYWGGHGIVGAQVGLGAGLAFANKYMGRDDVCVTMYGDGAANQGQVFESMNYAALWGIPVLFVIENNQYGMGTAVCRASAGAGQLYKRGEALGIPGEKVNGQDVFAVAEATARALDYMRANMKPYIIEFDTYRYYGHSKSDPGKYRTKEEVEDWQTNRDPIITLGKYLVAERGIKQSQLDAWDEAAKAEALAAAEFADASPQPDPSVHTTHVIPE